MKVVKISSETVVQIRKDASLHEFLQRELVIKWTTERLAGSSRVMQIVLSA